METFIQFAVIISLVLVVSFVIRLLKQPLIIGYILSGILAGPFLFNIIRETETLLSFSEMGVAFLLFIVGLSLSPTVIKEVGKVALVTGIGQIVFTSLIGFVIGLAFGFDWITSLYVAIALTFSSTIIIMKLLADNDAIDTLYGKISIGFLLVQDIVAILILIIVSSFANGDSASSLIFSIVLKGGIAVACLVPISYYVLPKLSDFFAKSTEFLFLFAISWGFGLSILFLYIGFTIEVGALIAGVMLSISPYNREIASKLRPLRDFFIISFFVILGSQMFFGDLSNLILPAIVFSLFVLIGNPIIVLILMGILGYSKKTGFMAGLTVAQISEFSFILIALGVKIGNLSKDILSFVTLIGLVTIVGSTYMIIYSEKIYKRISSLLSIFERRNINEKNILKKSYEYILFGENRIGFSIMKYFIKSNKDYLIIDFNPVRVKKLCKKGIHCLYGDISNAELLDEINLTKAELIVSTVPEKESNLMLLEKIKQKNKKTIVIVTGRQISEAFELYEKGADYVVLPHFLSGQYLSEMISKAGTNKKVYIKEKKKQIKDLKERIIEGQEHPKIKKELK